MTLHFIHIGKTGGTALKRALRKAECAYWRDEDADSVHATRYGPIKLHHHRYGMLDVGPEDHAFFCLRDPIDRFLSAFYSRVNKGQPSYHYEWSDDERRAFEAFATPQRLAGALASGDAAERALAQWAMRKIQHMGQASRVVGTPAMLRSRLRQVAYVARQETLSTDWEQLKELLELPSDAKLPASRKRAHRRDPSLDASLDPVAVAALREWYRGDYRLLWYCDALRAWHGWGAGSPPEGGRRLRYELARIRGVPAVLPLPSPWIRRRLPLG